MLPVKITLPAHTAGDTWEGMTIGPVLFDGGAPPAALAGCRLYIRVSRNRALMYGFQTAPQPGFGEITIIDAINWQVAIAAQPLPVPAGTYDWDFETTDATGVVRTLYAGTITISQDVTHD